MSTTPLQTIREQGFNAYMHAGTLVVGPWSRMDEATCKYIGANCAAIILELKDEAVARGDSDLCGHAPRYIPELAANNHVTWYMPESLHEVMGYQPASWREPINRAHGRPLGA